jgi:predicted oxidoreductase
MKTLELPGSQLAAPNVIAGMMRITDMDDAAIRTLTDTALDAGINFFDHADVYGGAPHVCERRWAEALRLTPARREELIIQTKAGIVNADGPYFDFSEDHILHAVEGSLQALRTDYIDVLLLHRPDTLMEPEQVAAAFDKLWQQGKVRHFGVSNQTPGQIELLRRAVAQPIMFNQVQLSITHCPLIAEGIAANMAGLDQSVDRGAGILDYCRLNGITLQAWSPFQKAFFNGTFLGDRDDYPELNDVIDALAAKYGVPAIAIAVAWITRHPANMQVVLGTTTPERVAGAAQGSDIPLTRAEWYALFRAAGHTVP